MTYYEVDTSQINRELDRLEHIDAEAGVLLDAALTTVFAAVQARVHVLTGRLKASGRMDTDHDRNTWIGEFTFGDPPAVIYAEYERRRGGSHDYLAPARDMDRVLEQAILDAIRG